MDGDRRRRGLRRRSAGWAILGLVLWLLLVPGAFVAAPTLNLGKLWGFPLGYLIAAQGGLWLLVAMVAVIVKRQERIESRSHALEASSLEQHFPASFDS